MSMSNKGGIFTSVQKKRQSRSNFNLSHDVKLSLDMGELVPSFVQEVVPGDSFKIRTSSMLRMAPLVSPVMHKINVYQEFFFVPTRILWSNWETFITGARNGKQLSADEMPAFPLIRPYGPSGGFEDIEGTVADYMGIPPGSAFDDPVQRPSQSAVQINAIPFAAYQRIYDEYYRDQDLQESIYDETDWADVFENYNQLPDGLITNVLLSRNLLEMRHRAWEHDYFTSARPWAQKGEEVRIPVDTQIGFETPDLWIRDTVHQATSGNPATGELLASGTAGAGNLQMSNGAGITLNNSANLTAEASGTINDLRAAIKLQEWLETNARGGSRYFESIYAHFGVKSPDSRLQRPEFIGSNRSNMVISEVLQTSSPQGETDTPQGNMSGHGQAVNGSKTFKYYAQEHGYIIGLTSVMPTTAYMQGVERFWFKTNDRMDYYFPEFAHLGEQEILRGELFIGNVPLESHLDTFGYTPRYADYKFRNGRVAGDFRSTLDYWHLARKFDGNPKLNASFVQADPSKRIFAVEDLPDDGDGTDGIRNWDSIYAHIFYDVKASRLMPKYGTPRL